FPQQILQHSQQQRARASDYGERGLVIGGVPNPASHFPEVAALQKTYDSHYVHGSPASRKRYGEAYATIAFAHPNILPLPQYPTDEDGPYLIPDLRLWGS
ncbi:unnamed protein product, partial [Rotaria magnacalcarata]